MSDVPGPLPVTSSEEPEWPNEAWDCYREAILALREQRVPFVVGGAFAVHMHTGVWRTTKDLDLLLKPESVPAALQILEARGFRTHIQDPVWLAKAHRGDYFVDLITGIGNASLVVDANWIDRSVPEIVLGIPCTVMAVEELIVSKLFVAYRERFDGADLVHLINARARTLDWKHLLALTGPHWNLVFWALTLFAYVYPARADEVPREIWDDLIQRFTSSVLHPDRQAAFCGTLLDPRMFAIDVGEWGERDLYKEYCARHPWRLNDITETHR